MPPEQSPRAQRRSGSPKRSPSRASTTRVPALVGHVQRLWRIRAVYDAYGAEITLGLVPRPGTLRNRAVLMMQGYGLRL